MRTSSRTSNLAPASLAPFSAMTQKAAIPFVTKATCGFSPAALGLSLAPVLSDPAFFPHPVELITTAKVNTTTAADKVLMRDPGEWKGACLRVEDMALA